jgi:hypothetical protein
MLNTGFYPKICLYAIFTFGTKSKTDYKLIRMQNKDMRFTLLFYLVLVTSIILINVSGQFKSGSCTPNLDLLSFFILGPISGLLVIINGLMWIFKIRQTKYSLIIHLFVLTIWIAILTFNSLKA